LGNKKSHELPLLRKQWNAFQDNDIFLGDRLFCSYFDIFSLKDRCVDSVIPLARRMPVSETKAVKKLGQDDILIRWKKPVRSKASSYSQEDWEALPDTLLLRQIKVTVNQAGFRVSSFYIITTLLDAADRKGVVLHQISFKASVQALRQWEPHINQINISHKQRNHLIQMLYEAIAGKIVPYRPGRSEPRAVKRMPKPFPLLTTPRQQFKAQLISGNFG